MALNFANEFKIHTDAIVGKTLQLIVPTHTDWGQWLAVLGLTAKGVRACDKVTVCTALGEQMRTDLTGIPVVCAPRPIASHTLALLAPTAAAAPG